MKSKKPGYRAGGPASRVRPRTPARRVAGKPTPLQTEQMRAAATLASKQAASKRRATLAQRKRTMAANKQNPNLDIKPNDIKPNTGKTSAQRKKLFDTASSRAMAAQRKKSFNAARSKAMGEYNAVTRSAAPPKSVRSEPVTPAQMAAQRKKLEAKARRDLDAENKQRPVANVKKGIQNAKPLQSTKVSSAQMKATKAQRGPTAPTKAKSAIHRSLEAFTAAARASTKNRSTPKAKPLQSTKVSSARMKAMKAQRKAAAPTQSRPSAKPPWANKGNTGK